MKNYGQFKHILAALLLPAIMLPAIAKGLNRSVDYHLDLGPASRRERVLTFPKDYSLGEIIINDWPQTNHSVELCGAARGTIVVPPGKMVRFVPAYHFYKNPSIIKTLPPDGFDSVLFAASSLDDAEDGMCDRALANVGHLTGLIELDLDRSDATDSGAVYAKDLPNVQKITAFSAAIEGKCFKHFSKLQHLHHLRLPRNGIKDENLQYLSAIPELEYLDINHCTIGDAGVKYLANCKRLVALNISDNPRITDQSIKYLLGIKTLRCLIISSTSITARGVLPLKALSLSQIDLPFGHCSKEDLDDLRQAFPGFAITSPGGKARTLNSEETKIFAPLH